MQHTKIERDLYTVNDDHTITLKGWLEERDNNWEGFYDDEHPRQVFVSGDWPDYPNDPSVDTTDWASAYQQYNDDMHYEEAMEFVARNSGTHLPLCDVTDETPAGDYWCTFDEEPQRKAMAVMKEHGFSHMYSETSWDKYGWGWALKPLSTVYLRVIGDTRIWVGALDEEERRFVCEVEDRCDLAGQWDGDTPYEALLYGLIDAVIRIAVKEMWNEPKKQGLKYCCEDVVNAAATYGAQLLYYGFERLSELFPHGPEGVLTTPDELGLYDDLIGAAIEYVKFDCRHLNGRLGIEFEDVWS